MENKIKIVFLGASPANENRLRIDEEARDIERSLDGTPYRQSFEFVTQWAVRIEDIQLALLNHKPHIVHFSGHGTQDQGVVIEDKLGNQQPIGAQTLKALFTALKGNIRLIVLNACFSAPQARAISKVIDHIVGMNNTIKDDAAVAFASSFYRMIAFGNSVRDSFDVAKTSLMLPNLSENKKPKLLVREGVDSTRPFLAQLIPAPTIVEKEKPRPVDQPGSRNINIGGSVSGSYISSGDNTTMGNLSNEREGGGKL